VRLAWPPARLNLTRSGEAEPRWGWASLAQLPARLGQQRLTSPRAGDALVSIASPRLAGRRSGDWPDEEEEEEKMEKRKKKVKKRKVKK